jgi:hypothetical protein
VSFEAAGVAADGQFLVENAHVEWRSFKPSETRGTRSPPGVIRGDTGLTPADNGFTFRVGQRHTPALAGVV